MSARLRKVVLFLSDSGFGLIALFLAFFLRVDNGMVTSHWRMFYEILPFFIICRSMTFAYFGFYSRFWEYSSLEDLIHIIKAVLAGSAVILFAIFFYNRGGSVFRSILFIEMVLLIGMLGGSRLIWRVLREKVYRKSIESNRSGGRKALVLGAGFVGANFLKQVRSFSSDYSVVGFVDDDPKKEGSNVMGVQVLGQMIDIPRLVEEKNVKEVLVAIRDISPSTLEKIMKVCGKCGVRYKLISSIVDLSTKKVIISKVRNIETADLLGRKSISLDLSLIKSLIQGKRVLITGAGGSIGSELCSQILELEPSDLIMVDKGENYLYELSMSLSAREGKSKQHYILGSVTDKKKMTGVFDKFRPQLVFHAAAYKHVPLMEDHVNESVVNNIYGTQLIARLSDVFKASHFVLVSTDKVVRPSSIMGMTKKLAEKYVRHYSSQSLTRFMVVRFGNVLGSNGSVIPVFQKQMEAGGPITITHPDMERYFMLISEAVQLILQAAAMGRGDEVFLLEMGEPVRIMKLAERMIKIAGYNLGEDMEIKITGMRPGEKLTEELIDSGEKLKPTSHEKIKYLISSYAIDANYNDKLEALIKEAFESDRDIVRQSLRSLACDELAPVNLLANQEK